MTSSVEVTKSEDEEPVPTVWRWPFKKVAEAFRRGDFNLSSGIAGVDPISEQDAALIIANLEAYGAKLSELPEETWSTSVSRWTGADWKFLLTCLQ